MPSRQVHSFDVEALADPVFGLEAADSARLRGLAAGQTGFLLALIGGAGSAAWTAPSAFAAFLVVASAAVFGLASAWRLALIALSLRLPAPPPEPREWPRYTLVAALHDEAAVVGKLIERLSALDYPPDRLQGFLALEAHDHVTIQAAERAGRPDWLQLLIVPPGQPQTKPRALNHALMRATGELITVYDAEDAPDPGQLKAAAARFAADRDGRLACLQAPLRIRRSGRGSHAAPFLDRQFAAEYAALFEVVLPGLAALGLPFPLGGTSNHFRTAVLKAVGAWDAWNVTEDADLGFRLWRRGWRLGVLATPTWETPPGALEHWLPQRTRWLKGHMQTWGVQTRRPLELGGRGLLALTLTLGLGLAAAAAHGPALLWLLASVAAPLAAGLPPAAPLGLVGMMVLGMASAWATCWIGARRAGVPYGLRDMIAAPIYWSLLSLSFAHAFVRLVSQPFTWDKTAHLLDVDEDDVAALDEARPERLSALHATAPEPVA